MLCNVTVTPTTLNGVRGFQVTALFRAPFEDMFERIVHPAVFSDVAKATVFASKVRQNPGRVNLANWILPTDVTSHIQSSNNPVPFLA